MIHCTNFEPMDIWVLVDNEQFVNRRLSFGICPICQKPIAILIQFNCFKNMFEKTKKIGFESQKFVEKLKKQKWVSVLKNPKSKIKTSTYKWVYGINKTAKNKTKQYAKDFFGNSVLIKEY